MIHKYQEIQNCDIAKVRLLVRGGSQKEKKYENGITHLLEHMNLFFAEKEPFELSVRGTTDFECSNEPEILRYGRHLYGYPSAFL